MPHPKIYKMDRSLSRETCHSMEMDTEEYPNRYSKNLLLIAQSLTSDDFSSIKLLLQTNNKFSTKTLETLKNSQDMMSLLDRRGIISKQNFSFLEKTLTVIKRVDLLKYARKCSSTGSESSSFQILCAQPSSTRGISHSEEVDCFEAQSNLEGRELEYTQLKKKEDPVEHFEGACAAATCNMEDEDSDCLQSSQGSITDDDKMALI